MNKFRSSIKAPKLNVDEPMTCRQRCERFDEKQQYNFYLNWMNKIDKN